MNVRFDHTFKDFSWNNVANKIVGEFINSNRKEEGQAASMVDALAIQLFERDLSPKLNKEKQHEMFIPEEAFPEAMKTWVAAKNALFIENTSSSRAKNNSKNLNEGGILSREIKKTSHHKQSAQIEPKTDPKHADEIETVSGQELVPFKPAYTFANTSWNDVEIVLQAREGLKGAWFFSNYRRGSVVIKSQDNPGMQVMGTVFLRCMGMDAPDSRITKRDSDEGQQISNIGKKFGLNDRDPPEYIIINRIYGKSYTNLSPSQESIQMIVNNLEKLGELAVYDLIIGNFDRFQLDNTSFNSGNIMFQNGTLQAIDTDCVYQEDREEFTKLALKKIIRGEGDFEGKISLKLARNLGTRVDPSLFPSSRIQAGMKNAIQHIIEFASHMEKNQQVFNKCCLERGVSIETFPKHVETFINYVKSCHDKNIKK